MKDVSIKSYYFYLYRMKNFFNLIIAFFSWLLLLGCGQEHQLDDVVRLSETDEIYGMIERIYKKNHGLGRSSSSDFKIINIDTRSYNTNEFIDTRSETDGSEYNIHTVTVDFGESTGFVILSDTPGLNQIFYYTEHGCISDTAKIEPLKEMIESFPVMAAKLRTRSFQPETPDPFEDVDVRPLVPFYWTQEYPFNYYATYCDCSICAARNNHRVLGCVTVAVAQVIATLKLFRGTFYGNRYIDFESFPKYSYQVNEDNLLDVAHFCQEIALNCQVKFGCTASSTSLSAAVNYLRDLGYKVDHKQGTLDKKRYVDYLKLGYPHIVGGHNKNAGHAWILDGLMNDGTNSLYHINWGFGMQKDGWSTSAYYGYYWDSEVSYPSGHEHVYLTLP